MKAANNNFASIIIILFLFSCASSEIEHKLTGTWVLDSTLSARGKFYRDSNERKILIFKDHSKYSFESWNGDAGDRSQGSFFLLKSPNRTNFTLTFVPDPDKNEKDTIRSYMNLDIISLSDSSLKIADQTRFIERGRSPVFVRNIQYIYKLHR